MAEVDSLGTGRPQSIVSFDYPDGPDVPQSVPGYEWPSNSETSETPQSDHCREAAEQQLIAELEGRLVQEARRSFEAGHERGLAEGRQLEQDARASVSVTEQQHRIRQGENLIDTFARERDRYLQRVEGEVVKLALAVAARILRRESQMDPMLLMGAVRVALGQLALATRVHLRVPKEDLDLWTKSIALLPNLSVKPEVVVGEGMLEGDCTLDTEMGSVDLGLRAQLAEIERGFFDRVGRAKLDCVTEGTSLGAPSEEGRP